MKKIGFLINPIAGMGGLVGLKGTDGREIFDEALKRGAKPVSMGRAKKALEELINKEVEIVTCSGEMGESVLSEMGFEGFSIVYSAPDKTSADDTKKACKKFLERGATLILFCGGDGTARDVYSIVKKKVPILGIPAGVKMHSAVFARTPEAANKVLVDFLKDEAEVREVEIVDTDEEKYRQGMLNVKLFGYALTPYEPLMIQGSKAVFSSLDEETAKEGIARFMAEVMGDGSLYILGPGTTVKKVADFLEIEKTLLGVDVVKDEKVIAKDVGERQILELLKKEDRVKILVSPIGAQGFIFGRGNQQISARVIKIVEIDNVIILATPHKLAHTPMLFVDTGDAELDKQLCRDVQVIVGYRLAQRRRIERV